MHRRRALATLVTLSLCAAPTSWAQTGAGTGQSFAAPAATPFLVSIHSGELFGGEPGQTSTFFLYQVSGTTLVGAPVFQQSVTGLVTTELDFSVNRLLTPGATYAFFLGTPTGSTAANFGGDFIPDGEIVFCVVRSGAGSCSELRADEDINHFGASFGPPTTAPEPASLALLAPGLVAITGAARRRRRA